MPAAITRGLDHSESVASLWLMSSAPAETAPDALDEVPQGYHVEYLWNPRENTYSEQLVADIDPDLELERAEASYEAWREEDAERRAIEAAEALGEEALEVEEEPEPSFEAAESALDPLSDLTQAIPCVVGRAATEKLAAAPVPYVWGQIVVQGTINLFAGGPSSGKSTLLFLLLAARSSTARAPLELLGYPVAPAPARAWIILIEGEHGEKSTARKLLRSYEILDAPLNGLDRVVTIARKAVTVGSPAWRKIESLAARGHISDVFLDTLARVSPPGKEANDERAQVEIFERLAKLIEVAPSDAQPTLWIAAHTRKGEAQGASPRVELEDVSGSAQRTGQCDSVIGVWGKKNKARTVDFLKLREEPDEYPEEVKYTIHGTEMTIETIGGRRVAPDGSPEEAPTLGGEGPAGRILSHLRAHPEESFSATALRKVATSNGSKLGNPHFWAIIESLVKSGRVSHQQEGDFVGYRWAVSPSETPGV